MGDYNYPGFDTGQPGVPVSPGAPVPGEPPEEEKKKRKGGFLLLFLAIILAVCGVGLGGYYVWQNYQPGTYPDMAGNRVIPDPDAVVPVALASATPDLGNGMRFIVSSVGLNVPLGICNEVNGVIAPPGFTSAYLIRNLGVPLAQASKGTVYVAAHSLRNGGLAPGNYLIDVADQKSKVNPGDTIQVGNLTYTITETRIIPKPEVGDVNDLWTNVPKRLIVFTCLQNAQHTPSTDNMIIIATLNS